eukprot:gnl/TRDRNA2_/TRDRNA2_173275_c2_seq8.p1 gnl/TRDRNA2_/TRDRNA2_173275_c2~~gnl/TRDRNA2_/TRDRNA2_173275_c2_seq8.p1  ORF type:complete len:540 (+),score=113.69 gnl/TRDRNA2_/TRDRNA2_173275_c2_seq8:109-1728(+)
MQPADGRHATVAVWEVVGGIDKGGILVRKGKEITSQAEEARLATGALVEELELDGERLRYRRLDQSGPATGWVSIRIVGKDLLAVTERAKAKAKAVAEACDASNGLKASGDNIDSGKAGQAGHGSSPPRIWAVSDIHTDYDENLQRLKALSSYRNDILLLAGDVSHKPNRLRETLQVLREKFAEVFFCPGNHDLWLSPGTKRKPEEADNCADSLEKLALVERICAEEKVRTKPACVGGVVVVPMLSWYEAGFDTDPDIPDPEILPVEKQGTDFVACKWPDGLSPMDGSLARHFDSLNSDEIPEEAAGGAPVVSFSHFLPRRELLPEKRFLFYPNLPKMVGSMSLGERVERLSPRVHVFGHTHYGWSAELDGTTYVQAAVAYPQERTSRGFSLALTDPDGVQASPPALVFDGSAEPGRIPAYSAFWSGYYTKHPRCPSDLRWIYGEKRTGKDVLPALRAVVASGAPVDLEAILRNMLLPGDSVEVSGLESQNGKVLNGKTGLITKYVDESGRFEVSFGKGNVASLRRENLAKKVPSWTGV